MDEALRTDLVGFLRRRFHGFAGMDQLAEDLVQEAWLRLRTSGRYSPDKENFGYLSAVCVRLAYRYATAPRAGREQLFAELPASALLSEDDAVAELMRAEDAAAVLHSLKTLREVERIVLTQRYYGDFSFAEIARANGLNLNTTLSHHRRALEKLRPTLTRLLGYGKENDDE